jgi:hypothetical protein
MLLANKNINSKVRESVSGAVSTELYTPVFVYKAWTALEAAAPAAVHATVTMTTAAQVITTGITNPPSPRNVSVVAGHASETGIVTIVGTNIWDQAITESLTLNETTAVVGTKAFKTITEIDYPAYVQATTPTVIILTGHKLGFDMYFPNVSCCIKQTKDGVADTLPTLAISSSAIESNTVLCATALNGQVMIGYFLL